MPLSDEDRRRLEELEQDLAASDPELNLKLQSWQPRGMAYHGALGIFAALAGFALIIAGIITQVTIIGVIGFLIMGAGAHWFLSNVRPLDGSGLPLGPQGEGTSSPSGPEPGTP